MAAVVQYADARVAGTPTGHGVQRAQQSGKHATTLPRADLPRLERRQHGRPRKPLHHHLGPARRPHGRRRIPMPPWICTRTT
ncbi:hypothetical protein [Streptomyces sp. AK02-04a]|uniref:hypothetical protein n=1 Tax=Streptomyces sp. AK02-04a TaxID=3028649 RepID=UPI0029B5EAE3|nr:hypothetical protein [Streptomyces sp. AK02-04a]MDX3754033.1 hypothetical protein [Streptomyces sp. AK02-04a]